MALRSTAQLRGALLIAVLVLAGSPAATSSARAEAPPELVLLHSPPPVTTKRSAVFRWRTRAPRVRCRLDGAPARRCHRVVLYRGLRPGPHVFVVRAYRGTTFSWRRVGWTVRRAPRPAFADDFTGRALNLRRWGRYDSAGHAGHGLRRPGAVALDGRGHLVITAHMRGAALVSGGLSRVRARTYGRYVFRVRTDVDPTGTMSGVVLTWPDSGRWPDEGEVDVYETGAAAGTRDPFHSFVHFGAGNRQYGFTHPADAARWHTLALDWRPWALRFYRDGALVWTVTDPAAIPTTPHRLCVQLDARRTRALSRPVRMEVDYVRIYR